MNDYNPGGGGCLSVPVLLLVCLLLFGALVAGGGDDTNTNTANVEALSRNQVNILSDVTNEYYDCYGVGSCVTSVTSTSTSSQTSTTNVDGDRNVVYSSAGVRLCVNPDNPNEWGDVAAWCEAAGVQP